MLKELKTQHREIARLRFEGLKPSDIAKRLEMASTSVYAILRDPFCKAYIDGLHDRADTSVINVREQLATMNTKALNVLEKVLADNPEDNIKVSDQIKVAESVLDRNGYKAPEQHNHAHAVFTAEDLLELQGRAKEVNTEYLDV